MSFFDHILGNLRGSGIVYLVCIVAIVGALKYMDNHPEPKKFTLLGAVLILVAGIGGGFLQAILFQVMVGTTTPVAITPGAATNVDQVKANLEQMKRQSDALATWGYVSGTLGFLSGLAYAAGIASFVYAVFVDKLDLKAKRTNKQKAARRRDDDNDEDDRPRRKRSNRNADEEDEEEDDEAEDDRPRRKPRRD